MFLEKIARNLGDIAKVRGMSQLARETGLSRENLYRSLSGEGRPEFATILKVSRALGFSMALCISENMADGAAPVLFRPSRLGWPR